MEEDVEPVQIAGDYNKNGTIQDTRLITSDYGHRKKEKPDMVVLQITPGEMERDCSTEQEFK